MNSTAMLPVIDAAACCAPLTDEAMTQAQADDLARSLKALADPARLRLLSIIAASEGDEACVCDLTDALDIGQPTVSHHLRVLADAGFITRSKRGTWAYYALVPGALGSIARVLAAA
jgi:ArsR family transcriptional regulator, arsenate/arsenite/antimonite-responsive transcriptional repressor